MFCGGLDKSCNLRQLTTTIPFSLHKRAIKISLFLIIWNWRELLPTQNLVKRHLMWQQKPRRRLTQKSLSTELQRVYSRTLPKVVLARREQTKEHFHTATDRTGKKVCNSVWRRTSIRYMLFCFNCYSYLIYVFPCAFSAHRGPSWAMKLSTEAWLYPVSFTVDIVCPL